MPDRASKTITLLQVQRLSEKPGNQPEVNED